MRLKPARIETHPFQVSSVKPPQNGLILQLSSKDQALIQQICKPVELMSGQTLCGTPDDPDAPVYFLTGATVALLIKDESDASVAVGLLGNDGVVGMSDVLNVPSENLTFQVQTAGSAWCARSAELRRVMSGSPDLLWALSRHLWRLVEHVAHVTASLHTQDIRLRLAAWLLLSADKAQTLTLHLTHEHLARMLGVRRVSITLAAGELRESGFLSYTRGRLHIVDKAGLEKITHVL